MKYVMIATTALAMAACGGGDPQSSASAPMNFDGSAMTPQSNHQAPLFDVTAQSNDQAPLSNHEAPLSNHQAPL